MLRCNRCGRVLARAAATNQVGGLVAVYGRTCAVRERLLPAARPRSTATGVKTRRIDPNQLRLEDVRPACAGVGLQR